MINFRIVIGMLVILCILGVILIIREHRKSWIDMSAFFISIGIQPETSVVLSELILQEDLQNALKLYDELYENSKNKSIEGENK